MSQTCLHCRGDGCEFCESGSAYSNFSGSVFLSRCTSDVCSFESMEVLIGPDRITGEGIPEDVSCLCPMCGSITEWAYVDEA